MEEHEKQARANAARTCATVDSAGVDMDTLESEGSPCSGGGSIKPNSPLEGDFSSHPATPIHNSPEDHLSPSSMTSCDMERPSPLEGSPCMDCSDDGGSDDVRVSVANAAITSSWVR
ncbi:hypothetical protein FHG87_022808 [Trinorchestia longiramus]|nr:hypothetical protein FHG87_022808 [Trinorchestia longiramus]